jgi:hypothetical protein
LIKKYTILKIFSLGKLPIMGPAIKEKKNCEGLCIYSFNGNCDPIYIDGKPI